jgi:hypothetical protein
MFGDGAGRMCQVSGVAGAPTYNVDNPGGIVSTGLGTQYLRPGMRLCAFTNEASGPGAGTFRVTAGADRGAIIASVDYVAGTVTLDNAIVALADNDYLYRVAEISSTIGADSTSRGMEPNGLASVISDVNPPLQTGAAGFYPLGLGEIDAAGNQAWQAFVLDNGGVAIPFSQDMLQQASDGVDIQGDGTVGMWMTTHGIRRQYLNSLVANKRFPGMMKLDGGFSAVEYNGRPLVVDKDCTRGRIYGIDLQTIEIYYETDYQWMDADGSILHRVPDHDAYQATLYRYWQLGTWARNRNCAVFDIQDT